MNKQLATFGAGCFWGVEELFRQQEGVISTAVGYMGGKDPQADRETVTYEQVCSGLTGHAEVVQVAYDPEAISYGQLLKLFWENHNPTTLNRQGPDEGTQYRSVVFFHSPEQEKLAQTSKEELQASNKFGSPIVTQIVPASTFYKAEDYHQQYLAKRGLSTCPI